MIQPRDLVVIGASRGGLEALNQLASGLTIDFPAAVLIVLHTSPDSPRMFARIMGQHTPLSVEYAEQGGNILPGHILFAPPDRHMVVFDEGFIGLHAGPKVHHSRPAADVLFRSAAEVYGPRVIGVVLTGGDGDGTDGLRAIKAAGGISVVQEPDEAIDPSMPRSALQGGSPDYRVPLDEMAELLTRLVTDFAHDTQRTIS
ncbi:chemotaxis protein CheB [Lichenibacterium minor]|uniref:protein-glutamate methylesterase n=2 Tax=Lichenibacterium minor TaxID=2316528 RepID=A0A4Q2U277_9HYPH|nr:chemotaxis protein CheB [Lichenibacterium minor]RYC28937.1 chemotaxis protein CheB [Lichenibacterium minor]